MKRPRLSRGLVAVSLLPVLAAGLTLWGMDERVERLDAVPAAVVNLDQPVESGTGQDRQIVAAGRLLAAGLLHPPEQQATTLDWRVTNRHDARTGLRDGTYHAVVTIPRGFSAAVAGLSRNEARTAEVTVRTGDASGAVAGAVGRQLTEAATDRLNRRVTATFLEGMYARTGELKASLGDAERGADRLADGAHRLGRGTAELGGGAQRLAGGLGDLSSGADRMSSGAGQLAGGASRLSAGTDRLGSGAAELGAGAHELQAGLGRLHERTRRMPAQTRRLADGADQVADGVAGWAKVLEGWRQACAADPVLASTHARLCVGTSQAVGTDGENAEALTSGSRQVAAGADRLADGAPALTGAIGQSADGAGRLAAGADRLEDGIGRTGQGAERLEQGARRLAGGATRLSAGARQAGAGAERLAQGSEELADGTGRLRAGSGELASGLGRGARQIPDLDEKKRQRLARAVAAPSATDEDGPRLVSSFSDTLAPGVAGLALWLGAFVTYLVRRGLPRSALAAPLPPWRMTLAGWLPGLVAGVVQALGVWAVLAVLEVPMASPAALAALLVGSAAVLAAVHQALVAALGRVGGWSVSLALLVLQAVSLGGVLPEAAAPSWLESVGGVLPVAMVAEAAGALALGGAVDLLGPLVGIAAWGLLALGVTTLSVRGAQRVSLSDLRGRFADDPAHAPG